MELDAPASRKPRSRRIGEIDIDYDERVENVWLRVQRIGWPVMALLVLAGLAGLFGRGPLAQATTVSADGSATLRYERFARFRTPTAVELAVEPASTAPLRVAIDNALLERESITTITPRPLLESATGSRTIFEFALPKTPQSISITNVLEAVAAGRFDGTITVGNATELPMHGFVYP